MGGKFEFDGTSISVEKEVTIPYLYQEAISGETVVSKQGTPKIGCHATLKVKEFRKVHNAKECSQQTQDEESAGKLVGATVNSTYYHWLC